jgi:polar amino acid transport system ATP-binding protein
MLKVNYVTKGYKGYKVLSNISFKVEENVIMGLAGPSGGGKSTLLRCIQRLEMVDSGKIVCNKKTGFMFQDFQLFPHMTVLENLVYAPLLNKLSDNVEEDAIKILSELGIRDKINCYSSQLSGGEKQRAALARSLMMKPSLLLCDEPTSGLDVATIMDVISLLKSVKNIGITMIIASHDLDFLVQIADKIILLKNGKIAVSVDVKTAKYPIPYLKSFY